MEVTLENLHELYANPNGNLYTHGEIVDGFSEEDIRQSIKDGNKFVYYESTLPTINDIRKEAITDFIVEHWDPKFINSGSVLTIDKKEQAVTKFTILGDTTKSDKPDKQLIDGVLWNLSLYLDIAPIEAYERFLMKSTAFLEKIHLTGNVFDFSDEESKELSVDEKLERINKTLYRKIDDLNRKHKKAKPQYAIQVFINELLEMKPVQQPGVVIRSAIDNMFYPFVFKAKDMEHGVAFTSGDFVKNMVHILGITHTEAVFRYNRAIDKCTEAIDFDVDKAYRMNLIKYGNDERMLLGYTQGDLIKAIEKYNLSKDASGKTSPIKDLFTKEILEPVNKKN